MRFRVCGFILGIFCIVLLFSGVGQAETTRPAGSVVGRVNYAGKPIAGIVLRLVREEDHRFVPGQRATTDREGRYQFPEVPTGRYLVYVYVEDNPDYFNRESRPFPVGEAEVVAPSISLGRVLRPVRPLPKARLPYAERLSFAWTPCPGAAHYEFTVTDPETHEEVAYQVVKTTKVTISGRDLSLGRRYQCHVLALRENGDFLGATPGRGADPWLITIVASEDSGSSTDSGKED